MTMNTHDDESGAMTVGYLKNLLEVNGISDDATIRWRRSSLDLERGEHQSGVVVDRSIGDDGQTVVLEIVGDPTHDSSRTAGNAI